MSILDSLKPNNPTELGILAQQEKLAQLPKKTVTSTGLLLQESAAKLKEAGEYGDDYLRKNGPFKLNPFQVRRGEFANRLEDFFTDPKFLELKELIRSSGGNTEAALVVETTDVTAEGEPIYEIITGHCRHEACVQLSTEVVDGATRIYPYLANVVSKAMPQQDRALRTMRENAGRNNTTHWEDAKHYSALLSKKIFANIRQLAARSGFDESWMGKLVRAASRFDYSLLPLISDQRNIQILVVEKLYKIRTAFPEAYELRKQELLNDSGKTYKASELAKLFEIATTSAVKPRTTREKVLQHGDQVMGIFKRNRNGFLVIELSRSVKENTMEKIAAVLSKQLVDTPDDESVGKD